jgi:hypothetical protein
MSKELKRMQELAGVAVNEEDTNDPVAVYLRNLQKDIMDLALVTDRFYKAWTDDPTPGSLTRFDKQEGGRIERQPSWKVAMGRFSGKDMYNYLLFKVSEMSNGLDLDKGNLDKYLDGVLDEILRLTKGDFNKEALIKEFPNSSNYIGQLGSGNVQKDKDILARLLTVDNSFLTSGGYGAVGKLKSDKELYKDFKDGTLFSSSFGNLSTVSEEKNKINKMNNEFKRMQELAGVAVNEVADFGSEGFKWIDSHPAPYFPAYQGFNNASDIPNKIKAYWDEVRREVKQYDQRDWGFYIGDTIPTYFKNVYMMLANQISSPERREYLLKGPTDPYQEEQIKKASGGKIGDGKKAFDFLKSIPDNYSFNGDSKFDSKYLGNDKRFAAINSSFQKLFNEYTSGPYYLLTPMIVSYVIQQFNDKVWDNRSGVAASFDRREKMKQGMKQDDTVPRLEENKIPKMSKELKRMQELAGVKLQENKKKKSLNESMIGGIVGIGAINQIPSRAKADYEDAFEHFLGEKYALKEEEEKEVKEGEEVELKENAGTSIDNFINSFDFSQKGNDELIDFAHRLLNRNVSSGEFEKLKSYFGNDLEFFNFVSDPSKGVKAIAQQIYQKLKQGVGNTGKIETWATDPMALQSLLDKLK